MELDRRRSPRSESARGLAAGEPVGARHGFLVEAEQAADRGGGAERPEDAGAVPAALARFREVPAEPDARGNFAARGERHQQVAAARSVALGDHEGSGHDFRGDVRERRAVHVAHGDGGDEIAVQHRGAGERAAVAADDARFLRLGERSGERGDLVSLFSPVSGEGASYRVEQQVLAMLPGGVRNPVVIELCREARKLLGYFACHRNLLKGWGNGIQNRRGGSPAGNQETIARVTDCVLPKDGI